MGDSIVLDECIGAKSDADLLPDGSDPEHLGCFTGLTPATSTITAPGLFPFSVASVPTVGSPYAVYAGECTADDPATVSGGAVTDSSLGQTVPRIPAQRTP